MCGLAGMVRTDREAPAPIHIVREMTAALRHRGPDDAGLVAIGPAAIGHQRLSIIDLEGGRQPMVTEDRRVALAYNGEIYNYRELRRELEGRGHRFRTLSDTEVVLASYLEYGPDCVRRFDGMFAIAVYDGRDGSLFLARDRLGIKPLYYAATPEGIAFGSELKAPLLSGLVRSEVDPRALLDYLNLRYVPAPRSIVSGIEKLEPAHTLVWRDGRIERSRYWAPEFTPEEGVRREEWRERLVDALTESVRARMVSDVPLGAFLSGGLDSSSVVALMAEEGPVRTSTVGFSESEHDERDYARLVADYFGTEHGEWIARPSAVEAMDFLAWSFDEPFGDSSAVLTYLVSRMTRRHVKVALGGDGADECFGGYRRHAFDRLEHGIRRRVPSLVRRCLIGPAAALWPRGAFLPRPLRAKTLLGNVASDPASAYYRSCRAASGAAEGLLQPDLARSLDGYRTEDWFTDLYRGAPATDALGKALYTDLVTWLPDDILAKVDRASMAVGLEVRVPFLSHRVVELAARMPSSMKIRGMRRKVILREAMRKRLPAPVLSRGKRGFALPVRSWLGGDLEEFARTTILSPGLGRFLDLDRVASLWKSHQRGVIDASDTLWLLLSLGVWTRSFFERRPATADAGAVAI